MDASGQLAAWRESQGLTLFQVATKIRCDPSTLNKLERRRRRPGADLRDAIESLTGIDRKLWKRVRIAKAATAEKPAAPARKKPRKRALKTAA